MSKYHKICYSDSYYNDRDACTVDTCVPGMANGSIIFTDWVNVGQFNYETLTCTECGAQLEFKLQQTSFKNMMHRAYVMLMTK